jgi:hypothetical protein
MFNTRIRLELARLPLDLTSSDTATQAPSASDQMVRYILLSGFIQFPRLPCEPCLAPLIGRKAYTVILAEAICQNIYDCLYTPRSREIIFMFSLINPAQSDDAVAEIPHPWQDE